MKGKKGKKGGTPKQSKNCAMRGGMRMPKSCSKS